MWLSLTWRLTVELANQVSGLCLPNSDQAALRASRCAEQRTGRTTLRPTSKKHTHTHSANNFHYHLSRSEILTRIFKSVLLWKFAKSLRARRTRSEFVIHQNSVTFQLFWQFAPICHPCNTFSKKIPNTTILEAYMNLIELLAGTVGPYRTDCCMDWLLRLVTEIQRRREFSHRGGAESCNSTDRQFDFNFTSKFIENEVRLHILYFKQTFSKQKKNFLTN